MKIEKIFLSKAETKIELPVFFEKVSAGFPSPAGDFIEQSIDLNELLIHNPSATFIVRASGDSMEGAGIFSNDLLLVDRSLAPAVNKVVVVSIDGELLVKRLIKKGGASYLGSENPKYPPILLKGEVDTVVWGVVTACVHTL